MKKYVFKPYSENFPRFFEKEKTRLISHIREDVFVEHIGSTAIPNMGGKGIIDIAIAVSRNKMDLISKKLQKLGYEFRPTASTPDRLFFRIDLPDPEEKIRRYHIHLTYSNSRDWDEMIKFRDYLRSNPDEARKYAEIKKRTAEKVNEDGAEYRKLKEPTIEGILEKLFKEHRFS